MQQSHAEAIVQAVLEPDPTAAEALRRKRLAEDRSLAERRRMAWFVLAGAACGAIAAYVAGQRVSTGILWGGVAAGVAARLWTRWRRPAAH